MPKKHDDDDLIESSERLERSNSRLKLVVVVLVLILIGGGAATAYFQIESQKRIANLRKSLEVKNNDLNNLKKQLTAERKKAADGLAEAQKLMGQLNTGDAQKLLKDVSKIAESYTGLIKDLSDPSNPLGSAGSGFPNADPNAAGSQNPPQGQAPANTNANPNPNPGGSF